MYLKQRRSKALRRQREDDFWSPRYERAATPAETLVVEFDRLRSVLAKVPDSASDAATGEVITQLAAIRLRLAERHGI